MNTINFNGLFTTKLMTKSEIIKAYKDDKFDKNVGLPVVSYVNTREKYKFQYPTMYFSLENYMQMFHHILDFDNDEIPNKLRELFQQESGDKYNKPEEVVSKIPYPIENYSEPEFSITNIKTIDFMPIVKFALEDIKKHIESNSIEEYLNFDSYEQFRFYKFEISLNNELNFILLDEILQISNGFRDKKGQNRKMREAIKSALSDFFCDEEISIFIAPDKI